MAISSARWKLVKWVDRQDMLFLVYSQGWIYRVQSIVNNFTRRAGDMRWRQGGREG